MSSRPQFDPKAVLNATTGQAMVGDLTSLVTIVQKLSMISYGVSWSGTSPVGNISIQASNDYSLHPDGSVNNAGTWNSLTFLVSGSATTQLPVSGNTGNGFIDMAQSGAYALRLIYVHTSGVGTLSAIINAKVA